MSKSIVTKALIWLAVGAVLLGASAGTASAERKGERQVDRLFEQCEGSDAHPVLFLDEDGSFTCRTKDGKNLTCLNQGNGVYHCWKSKRRTSTLPQAPDAGVVAPTRTEPTPTLPAARAPDSGLVATSPTTTSKPSSTRLVRTMR